MTTDKNGTCAMTVDGEQYDRRVNGRLYSCVSKTLEEARTKINEEITMEKKNEQEM
jgi:hypothetical protein